VFLLLTNAWACISCATNVRATQDADDDADGEADTDNGASVDADDDTDDRSDAPKVSPASSSQQQASSHLAGSDANNKPTYESWLVDLDDYNAAPQVAIPSPKPQKNGLWWGVKTYEKYYQRHPIRAHVPRIKPDVQITPEGFHELFIRHGRPVIFSFDNMRDLGFTTQSYSLEQLQEMFPYTARDVSIYSI
jgi:hypothetical protein